MTTPPLDPVYAIMAEHFLLSDPVDMTNEDAVESLAAAIHEAVVSWYAQHEVR
jgi:hypothetical protein